MTLPGTLPPSDDLVARARRGDEKAREQALDRMVEEAVALGANAVVEVRFSTSMVIAGAAELLVYGTAVVVEDAV